MFLEILDSVACITAMWVFVAFAYGAWKVTDRDFREDRMAYSKTHFVLAVAYAWMISVALSQMISELVELFRLCRHLSNG